MKVAFYTPSIRKEIKSYAKFFNTYQKYKKSKQKYRKISLKVAEVTLQKTVYTNLVGSYTIQIVTKNKVLYYLIILDPTNYQIKIIKIKNKAKKITVV